MTRVTNIKTLTAMQEAGLITLHPQTGVKIGRIMLTYIDDRTDKTPFTFEYKRKWYEVHYASGCFCPYVYQVNKPLKPLTL